MHVEMIQNRIDGLSLQGNLAGVYGESEFKSL
jgi:hypothetical protein